MDQREMAEVSAATSPAQGTLSNCGGESEYIRMDVLYIRVLLTIKLMVNNHECKSDSINTVRFRYSFLIDIHKVLL